MTEKKTTPAKKTTKKPVVPQAQKDARALAKAFEELQVQDFMNYLHSPWRIVWHNFVAGIFRGLGIIVGMTVVFALLVWVLTSMVDFPLIGQYFQQLLSLLEKFSTNQISR